MIWKIQSAPKIVPTDEETRKFKLFLTKKKILIKSTNKKSILTFTLISNFYSLKPKFVCDDYWKEIKPIYKYW